MRTTNPRTETVHMPAIVKQLLIGLAAAVVYDKFVKAKLPF